VTPGPQPIAASAPDVAAAPPPVLVSSSGDNCAACGAQLAADQRYCLSCGQRRGDPRLPFMDAVVFMDAVKRPAAASPPSPPPRQPRSRVSPNASLVAGVATLVLAIGVGVLIGRSGEGGSSTAAAPAPQVIKVGGGEEAATASTARGKGTADKGGKAKKAKPPEKAVDSSGTSEAAAEVLKPAGDVKLPPPTVQPGGKCESGAAGCKGEEFTGEFFGE
jgi:hypothetical protein